MAIENKYKDILKKDMVFKNYKAMCEYLNEPVKVGGSNKNIQAEQWKQYFSWETDSKYQRTITEVFEKDFYMVERNNKRNSYFKDSISLIILNILLKSQSNPYIESRRRLSTDLGLVNKEFHAYQTDSNIRAGYAKSNNHLYFSVDDYFKKANDNNRNRLKLSLDYLHSKDFIIWKNAYILISIDDNNITSYRSTTENEELTIMELRRDLLTQMGYDDLSQVFQKGEQKQFYQYLNPIINNEFNINGCYPVISMAFKPQLIVDYLEPRGLILSDEELNVEKRKLNDLTVDRIIHLAQKYNSTLVEHEDNSAFTNALLGSDFDEKKMIKKFKKKLFRALPDYLETTKELVNITIKMYEYEEDVTRNMDDWTTDIIVSSPLDDLPE